MIKLLAIICLCVGLSIVSSQSCADTSAARTEFGFGNTVTTPTAASGINYCSSIKNSAVCCTAADMNTIQTKTDALLSNLTNTVIARDQFFAKANVDPLGQLTAANTNFANTLTAFSTSTAGTADDRLAISQALTSIAASVAGIIPAYAANVAATNLNAFQAARTTCVVQMVKLQSAAWCLSCDPNAVTKGFNANTNALPLSANACTRLKTACYPFVSTSSFQTGPITVQELIGTMNYFSTLVARVTAGTAVNPEEFDYVSTNPPVSDVPEACTSAATCNFICDTIFEDGVINRANLIAGGDTSDGGRLLEEVEPRMLADRELQSGTYDPADDEAGVTVTFQNDPGNTAKSGVLSFGSVLIGAIVLLSSYLL